jgi:methylphosphotriester-DNA--protein-cysteine methyltransferase
MIYCKPTCRARLARRANVIFHDTTAEAEAYGCRPCLRCKPELSSEEREGEDPQKLAVAKACVLIGREGKQGAGRRTDKWTVKALAREVGLTESHFCRVFKKICGVTIGVYRASLPDQRTSHSRTEPVLESGEASIDFDFNFDPGQCMEEHGSTVDFTCDFEKDWYAFSSAIDCIEHAEGVYVRPLDMQHDDLKVREAFDTAEFSPEWSEASTMANCDGFEFLDFDTQFSSEHLL